MKIKLIIKLIVLLFISCDDNSKIKKVLKTLQSKSIIIPTTMNVFWSGSDTIINEFMDSEFKLLVCKRLGDYVFMVLKKGLR